jgi:cytochrome c oxidase assembly protein subunit 15
MTSFLRAGRARPVAIWLFAVAALVLVMVVVGGATRLTDSGLSITQWRPVTGVVPPLSMADWQAEFARYRMIPQYRQLNPHMSLGDFRSIYWWEWTHRFLGRLAGAAFAIPFAIFWLRGRLPFRLMWRCAALLVLGGLQGAVGWWMVASGLADRVSVAPERLAVHLGLALVLFVALVWTGLDAWFGPRRGAEPQGWPVATAGLLAAAFVQCLLGALVAGNDAGRINTDWPLMSGHLMPNDYAHGGFWETLAHGQAAVQFDHRLGAYLLLGFAVAVAFAALRSRRVSSPVQGLALLTAVVVGLQACLGVITLWFAAPLALSLAHQFGATLVLTSATVLAWRSRRP